MMTGETLTTNPEIPDSAPGRTVASREENPVVDFRVDRVVAILEAVVILAPVRRKTGMMLVRLSQP